jgi:hypothetical protein
MCLVQKKTVRSQWMFQSLDLTITCRWVYGVGRKHLDQFLLFFVTARTILLLLFRFPVHVRQFSGFGEMRTYCRAMDGWMAWFVEETHFLLCQGCRSRLCVSL